MASTLMSLPTSTFSLSLNKVSLPNKLANTRGIAPCFATFPSRPSRLPAVRAQAGGDAKDTAVDVHVNQGTTNQASQNNNAVETRPRRLALDVSPFGESITHY